MKTVDSSVWLEYFAAGPLADRFEKALQRRDELVTPAVVLYEVYRWILRNRGEEDAARSAALLEQTRLVAVDASLARLAAELSVEHSLAMADALVYATARAHEATLLTLDAHFEGLPGVEYHAKS